jgi:hypothetical protein
MPHSYIQVLYHVVYSTKNRHPWLTDPIRLRLYPYPGGAILFYSQLRSQCTTSPMRERGSSQRSSLARRACGALAAQSSIALP